jgi:hypothetical protein
MVVKIPLTIRLINGIMGMVRTLEEESWTRILYHIQRMINQIRQIPIIP